MSKPDTTICQVNTWFWFELLGKSVFPWEVKQLTHNKIHRTRLTPKISNIQNLSCIVYVLLWNEKWNKTYYTARIFVTTIPQQNKPLIVLVYRRTKAKPHGHTSHLRLHVGTFRQRHGRCTKSQNALLGVKCTQVVSTRNQHSSQMVVSM